MAMSCDLCKMRTKQPHLCPHCQGKYTVKNGQTYYNKQNYKCKTCKRQFVERPLAESKEAIISSYQDELVAQLLLERIALRGISRLFKKSVTWVTSRMKLCYERIKEDLPIGRLASAEIDLYLVEADELWSFIGAKDCPEWIWLAIERRTGLVVGFHSGGRDQEGALGLYLSIDKKLREKTIVYADDFASYGTVFPKKQLRQEGKKETTKIERFNNTIRQRNSRLVRFSLSFSKKWENHYNSIKYFIVNYNNEIIAKNPSL
jgi:IS1 family transposase/transposase-like protein